MADNVEKNAYLWVHKHYQDGKQDIALTAPFIEDQQHPALKAYNTAVRASILHEVTYEELQKVIKGRDNIWVRRKRTLIEYPDSDSEDQEPVYPPRENPFLLTPGRMVNPRLTGWLSTLDVIKVAYYRAGTFEWLVIG